MGKKRRISSTDLGGKRKVMDREGTQREPTRNISLKTVFPGEDAGKEKEKGRSVEKRGEARTTKWKIRAKMQKQKHEGREENNRRPNRIGEKGRDKRNKGSCD